MSEFKCGDLVIIKSTIGDTNEVREVIDVKFTPIGDLDFETYIVSGGSVFGVHQLELWNPKTDLEGGYKMKEIGMNRKYRTQDGRNVTIISINPELRLMQVVGLVEGVDRFVEWSLDGESWSCSEEIDCKLVEVCPYADFKIDDKVLVTNNGASMWRKGHFMGVVDGKAVIFDEGKTSHTSSTQGRFKWDKCIKWEDRTDDMVICDD